MSGVHYLSLRQATAALMGKRARLNGTQEEAVIMAVVLYPDGSPREYYLRRFGGNYEWMEAGQWTVIN